MTTAEERLRYGEGDGVHVLTGGRPRIWRYSRDDLSGGLVRSWRGADESLSRASRHVLIRCEVSAAVCTASHPPSRGPGNSLYHLAAALTKSFKII